MIRIIKKTNINGKVVGVGQIIDDSYLAEKDVRTLLNCGCAVKHTPAPAPVRAVETAQATPATQTANAAPAKRKRGKR